MPRRSLAHRSLLALAAVAALTLAARGQAGGRSDFPGGNVYEKVEAQIDLPMAHHQKNTGGSDGLGLCVFASLQMSAWWQGIPELADLFEWMKSQPGGGYPEKVARILKQRAPSLDFVQYEGKDPAILEAALKTGRPVGVTYGYGDLYGGQTIAHMVLLAHLDETRAAVIDNNDPEHWTWMSRAEFLKRWTHPGGQGWAVVLLGTPPPPIPRNSKESR